MTTPQPPELPSITTDDLLKMIGDRDVTISRQAMLINSQAVRLAEFDKATSSRVTTSSFDTADLDDVKASRVMPTSFDPASTGTAG